MAAPLALAAEGFFSPLQSVPIMIGPCRQSSLPMVNSLVCPLAVTRTLSPSTS